MVSRWERTRVWYAVEERSITPMQPLSDPTSTCSPSRLICTAVTAPLCWAWTMKSEKSRGHTRRKQSPLPVTQKPSLSDKE